MQKGEVDENHWYVAQSTMSCDENENKLYNRNAAMIYNTKRSVALTEHNFVGAIKVSN